MGLCSCSVVALGYVCLCAHNPGKKFIRDTSINGRTLWCVQRRSVQLTQSSLADVGPGGSTQDELRVRDELLRRGREVETDQLMMHLMAFVFTKTSSECDFLVLTRPLLML